MSGTIIMGIDPGMSGCLTLLSVQQLHSPVLLSYYLPQKTLVGSSSRIFSAGIAAWVREVCDSHKVSHCFIERVGAMPGQGVSSVFNFGHSTGVVEGIIVGNSVPVTLITPQAWKKTFSLIGMDKDAARSKASMMFPEVKDLHFKGKGQAIADSIFIALHGAQKL